MLHSDAIPDGDFFVSASGNVGSVAIISADACANSNTNSALVGQNRRYRDAEESAS